MLPQITNTGRKKPQEFFAVIDEQAPLEETLGRVLKVFPSQARAQRFESHVREAARLANGKCRIELAFHPSVDTATLKEITTNPVRTRIVQLKENLPVGAQVHSRLHLADSGPPRGSLRCL